MGQKVPIVFQVTLVALIFSLFPACLTIQDPLFVCGKDHHYCGDGLCLPSNVQCLKACTPGSMRCTPSYLDYYITVNTSCASYPATCPSSPCSPPRPFYCHDGTCLTNGGMCLPPCGDGVYCHNRTCAPTIEACGSPCSLVQGTGLIAQLKTDNCLQKV